MRIGLLPIGDMDDAVLAHLASELPVLGDVEILPRADEAPQQVISLNP